MTIDVSLNNVATFQNDTSAVTTVNANSASIVAAFEDALSISGTVPNQMQSNIDMNSNRILNLPSPVAQTEPLRVVDATTLNGSGTITVNPLPTGGTSSQVLTKNSSTNFDASWKAVTLTGAVNASQMPALTGDVTSTAGTTATTISPAAVSNNKMANMAAYTLKVNATNASTSPSDITIGSLTQKNSPVAGDTVMIADSAASGALKFATVGSISTIGSVASVGGQTGAITLAGDLTMVSTALTSSWSTGDIKWTLKSTPDTGWIIPSNGGTIGNATSGATIRANADTAALFALFWNSCSNAICPVSSGRGVSAAADYAVNKTLTLPNMPSRNMGIAGTGDAGTYGLGQTAGSNTASLVTSNLPAYTPSGSVVSGSASIVSSNFNISAGSTAVYSPSGAAPGTQTLPVTASFSGNAQGGTSSPFSVVQPTVFFNVMVKL